jgi:hypothetical protein
MWGDSDGYRQFHCRSRCGIVGNMIFPAGVRDCFVAFPANAGPRPRNDVGRGIGVGGTILPIRHCESVCDSRSNLRVFSLCVPAGLDLPKAECDLPASLPSDHTFTLCERKIRRNVEKAIEREFRDCFVAVPAYAGTRPRNDGKREGGEEGDKDSL